MTSARALAAISGFIGAGAAFGSTVVVPLLPVALYRPEILSNDLIPAIGLGIVALISIAATYALLTRSWVGAALGLAAGLALVEFKLVEVLAIGSLLAPPKAAGLLGHVLVWLQPPFIVIGLAMIVLALRAQRGRP